MSVEHTYQEGKCELHLTFDKKPALIAGWKYSAIDGDPLLGDGVKHYLTTYATDEYAAHEKIIDAMYRLAAVSSAPPLRVKIEHILYDVRYV